MKRKSPRKRLQSVSESLRLFVPLGFVPVVVCSTMPNRTCVERKSGAPVGYGFWQTKYLPISISNKALSIHREPLKILAIQVFISIVIYDRQLMYKCHHIPVFICIHWNITNLIAFFQSQRKYFSNSFIINFQINDSTNN